MSDVNSITSTEVVAVPKEAILTLGVKVANKKIKPAIDTLELLLIFSLANPTKKLEINDSLISKLAKSPKLSDEVIKELILLEKNKYFFTSLRKLLRFSDSIVGFPVLKDTLKGYLKESLCRNEIIVKLGLEDSINNIENSMPIEQCLRKIQELSLENLTEEYFKKIKSKDWKTYLASITLVLAEWFAKTRAISSSQLVDLLNNSLWSRAIKKKDPETVINNLLESTNFEIACSVSYFYEQKSIDAINKFLKTENQLTEITLIKNKLETTLVERNLLINMLQSDLINLNKNYTETLELKKVEIETLTIKFKNQIEDLRVRNLRVMQSSVELLANGLIAISREEPKVNVMKDHAQRVLDSLNAELELLRGFE
jgi:hypothetical protein